MRLRHVAAAVLGASLLSGCATGYHSANNPLLGWTGGYWDKPGPGELIKVGFSANGYSKEATVEDYLMLHCAEVAQSRNKRYFRLFGSIAEAIIGVRHTDKLVTPVTNGPSGFAYVLLEDAPAADTYATADVLAKYAHIRGTASATTPPSATAGPGNDAGDAKP